MWWRIQEIWGKMICDWINMEVDSQKSGFGKYWERIDGKYWDRIVGKYWDWIDGKYRDRMCNLKGDQIADEIDSGNNVVRIQKIWGEADLWVNARKLEEFGIYLDWIDGKFGRRWWNSGMHNHTRSHDIKKADLTNLVADSGNSRAWFNDSLFGVGMISFERMFLIIN